MNELLKDFVWPSKLINAPSTAIEYVDNIYNNHHEIWKVVKDMEDHLDGKRPTPPEELKKRGRLWANNWNYGKGRSKLEKTTTENVDTVLNAISMMAVNFKKLSKSQLEDPDLAWSQNPEIRDAVAMGIESSLVHSVDNDPRLIGFFNTIEYNTTAWGWCGIVKDQRDWVGSPQHIRTIGFPRKAKPQEIVSFCIFDTYDADYVWRKWHSIAKSDNLSVSRYPDGGAEYHQHSSGWILEGLEEVLYWSFNGKCLDGDKANTVFEKFDQVVPDFVRNPQAVVGQTDAVQIATIFNFEQEGNTITKTIVAYGNGWKGESDGTYYKRVLGQRQLGANSTEYSPRQFLYQDTIKATSISEVIDFVYDSGFTTNSYIQDMRGLARLCVEDSMRFNRKKNSIENKALFSGAPFLRKTQIGTGDQGPKLMPSQGFVILGDGYDLIEKQPNFDLNSQIASINLDEQHYDRETQHYDPNLSGRLSSRPVTAEIDAKSAEVRRIEGSKISIKLKCYASVIMSMLKSIKERSKYSGTIKFEGTGETSYKTLRSLMMDALEPYGIDTDAKLVKALDLIENIALEPVNTDINAITEQLSMATTPYRRLKLNRMLAMARGFSRKDINILHPLANRPDSLDKTKMAAMENIMFKWTEEVVFSPNDDHLGDLDIHMPKIFSLMESLQAGGGDPVEIYNWIARLVQHSGMHIDALLKMPYILDEIKEKYLSSYKDIMLAQVGIRKMVEQYASQLAQQQDQMAQAQQQGEQVDPKVSAKIQMDWAKLESRENIAAARSKFREDEKLKDNELRRRIKEEDHQEKIRRQNEMANTKKNIEMMKSQTSLL